MKTNLFTLALLLMSTGAFAQTAFNRSTFDALMNRYAQDPVKFLKSETAPDFVLAGSDGKPNSLSQTASVYDRLTQTGRSYEDVTVRQYGSTGVATGIVIHRYTSKSSGRPLTYRELFTYVFNSAKPGQWQMVSAQHSTAPVGTVAENEAAIRAVLEGHSQAVLNRDVEQAISYFGQPTQHGYSVSATQRGLHTRLRRGS